MYSNDFIILLALVNHLHDSDGLGTQEGHGYHRFLQYAYSQLASDHEFSAKISHPPMSIQSQCIVLSCPTKLSHSGRCFETHSYLHQNKHVQRVVVLAQGSRNKAIVVGVHNARIQDTVDVEQPCRTRKLKSQSAKGRF